ncbi:SH3 domain-containing protein [Chloroflexi bacterium TSY]|nr:SH3 domain-containing protein [Chloroflexi bacterium TSY]
MTIACGPEEPPAETSDLTERTHQIAQEYMVSQNLEHARRQLAELDVVNPSQWLLLATENSIAQNLDPSMTRALVELSYALGLQSVNTIRYAEEQGLFSLQPEAEENAIATTNDEGTSTSLTAENSVVQVIPADAAEPNNAQALEDGEARESNGVSQTSENRSGKVKTVADLTNNSSDKSAVVVIEAPTVTSTNTPIPHPSITANSPMNIRGGPGLVYLIVGALQANESADVVGKNPQGDWWQVSLANGELGWVYGPLVTTVGDVASVALADIPPTPLPPPDPPTATPAPVVEAPPAEEPPAPSGPDFQLIERRLWSVTENGGRMDGPSVICGEKRQLVVEVLDAAGNPLNGVAVQVLYGNKEIYVTGSQGKGDGRAEFVLGDGQDVTVIRDADGRDVSSDVARNLSTKPYAIDFPDLIQAGFCSDDASCQKNVVDVYACGGHYSWTAKFKKRR